MLAGRVWRPLLACKPEQRRRPGTPGIDNGQQYPIFRIMALRWVGLDKTVFSSNQLPPGLTDKERFRVWHDLFQQHVGPSDFTAPEGPFNAHMAFVRTNDVMLARTKVTMAGSEHGRHTTAADEERVGVLVNGGADPFHFALRRRDATIPPGAAVLNLRAEIA